jgi:23S rRNA-/tRNA-specific pseudouridylate synthase
VHANPDWERRDVDLPLRVNAGRRNRTVADRERGVEAQTVFQVLERFGAYSLIAARPRTGRRHQIRAHLYALGCPLIADPLYGPGGHLYLSQLKPDFRGGSEGECPILARPALHAFQLTIRHPVHGRSLSLQAPFPPDFNGAVRMLRKYGLKSRNR